MSRHTGTTRGFKRTATLLEKRVRAASSTRGFSESRVLTHWHDIVGEQIAAIARPVEVSYSRGGMGATLTVLTTGAQAPMLEMQKEDLRARVNATYGYNAIARIRITQTAPTGFADGKVQFNRSRAPETPAAPAPETRARAAAARADVADTDLAEALERLALNVYSKPNPRG
ncbi:DUF721 domain-containing protein [Pseudaestuariivita atlantica]|uniref:Zn-ribbon-containing protein n=1 Tax=Pseudaestuariivita atlantica TaxID=1317121 RepID=A0A0L1JPD4_9RHOB|nr:DUF721 domain-containing protein [Pseudaestuariivita atlantica]KNG93586.1 Zn-ribbon-containing protein [Pseudaestuariivita atlantica]